jgi:hypothetical protein
VFYAPGTLCDRGLCSTSVAVGLTCLLSGSAKTLGTLPFYKERALVGGSRSVNPKSSNACWRTSAARCAWCWSSSKRSWALRLRRCHAGCDRSIPQALCRQLPMLSAFGHVHVSDGHWFCRQVPLVDLIPPLTQPEHPQVQEDLAALDRPRHPRALEALRADKLARGFRDARAQW